MRPTSLRPFPIRLEADGRDVLRRDSLERPHQPCLLPLMHVPLSMKKGNARKKRCVSIR